MGQPTGFGSWTAGRAAWRAAPAAILIAVAATALAQQEPTVRGVDDAQVSLPVTRDEALWREICELDRSLPTKVPFSEHADAALRCRRALLEKVQLYLAAYPGGRRRDDAVRLELRALFEIGTLSNGAFEPLREQVADYLRHPPSEAAVHEAAYWEIHCRRLARSSAAPSPKPEPLARVGNDLLEAYRGYVERYPRSRYVPRMAAALFDAAVARGDWDEARALVVRLRRDVPQHTVTTELTARLQRHEAVGQPFGLVFQTADGQRIDTTRWKGQPVLIVVWAGFSESARACVGQIEACRAAEPELRVIGVNLDGSARDMNAACHQLGLAWPQFNDGMGWANRFALKWGVREVPMVFVVDRQGRLIGSSGAAGWRELLASAGEN